MRFNIMLGPANSGKSQKLCDEMVEAAVKNPTGSFIAIVPEQFTLQMQRRVVQTHEAHAVMNIDVVSFNRLAMKVFSELGISLNEILDDTGKALILRSVLEDVRDDLTLYKGKIHMQGFIEEMKSVIAELKTYGVSDEELKNVMAGLEGESSLSDKLKDIRLIYRSFNEKIKDIYTTSEEVPDVFARVLTRSKIIRGSHIYLDGFTGFTPVQYRIIEGFLSVCESLTCSITAPKSAIKGNCPESDLFYMTNVTYNRLVDLAAESGVKAETIYYAAGAEEAEKNMVNGPAGNQARILEYCASDPKDEAEFVALQIQRLVRDEGFRYRDIAVVTTDMESYYPHLEKSFKAVNIPAFIDHKTKIRNNRLARFILSALRVVQEKFSYDSVFSYLKCGLTDIGMEETDLLENYCLEFGIKGPVVWSRDFVKNRTLRNGEPAWNLEEMNGIRSRFMSGIAGFAAGIKRGKTAGDYEAAFEKLFSANATESRMEELAEKAEEYGQILGYIKDLLEKARILTKNSAIDLDDYIKIIRSGIDEIKIGLVPPTLDMVMAGDLERSRFNKLKALFIVGANEGRFPKTPSKGGILSQSERKILKEASLDMAPSPMENFYTQRYYIYLMLNKPKKYLYLTWPAADGSGEALSRSAVFDELDEYIAGGLERLSDAETAGSEGEDQKRLLAGQLREFAKTKDAACIDGLLLKTLAQKAPTETERLINATFIVNDESPLDEDIAAALYGDVLKGSVSRFEKFNECAFKHFLSYGLKIEKRPEYEIKATALGSVYHSALEKYVKTVKVAGLDVRTVDDEKSRDIARACAEEAIEEEESGVFKSSARNLYQAGRTVQVVVKTTDVIREKIREGNFNIEDVEKRFSFKTEDGNIFNGVIDRIDIFDNGQDIYVNVVDYKTGSKSFSLKEMYEGVQLQLPVYMSQAIALIESKNPGKNVHPSGIYYFLVKDDFEKEAEKAKGTSNIKGVDGSEDKIRALMEFTQQKLTETGQDIKSGNVSIAPLRDGDNVEACRYCDFKNVCRFKEGKLGARSKEWPYLDKEELEENIYGGSKVD